MKIRFVDFWSTFDATDNFFIRYFDFLGLKPEIVLNSRDYVDLEIVSVFPPFRHIMQKKAYNRYKSLGFPILNPIANHVIRPKPKSRKSKYRIWYTGENIRPPLTEDYDGYISFDQLIFGDRSIYFPLWMTHLDWFGKLEYNSRVGCEISMSELMKKRVLKQEKNKFAVVFMSNPHPFRLQVVRELAQYGQVDVYGAHSGNPVGSKLEVSRDYKYSICFENDLYPGYVTEKLLEAYLSDTVPLYWGDLGNEKSFNSRSFINLKDFDSVTAWIKNVKATNYQNMYEEALFVQPPSLNALNQFFGNILRDKGIY
jgi:hypothetical protein